MLYQLSYTRNLAGRRTGGPLDRYPDFLTRHRLSACPPTVVGVGFEPT